MKKVIFLFTICFAITIQAQTIIYEKGLAGLADSSGNILLPAAYDEIKNVSQFGKPSAFFTCRSAGKFGIYCSYDNVSTGCIYDTVYSQYNMLYVVNGRKFGFVSQTTRAYKIIEPQYDFLFPMREHALAGREHIQALRNYHLAAKKDSLWGVLSFEDGHEVLPFKYLHEVTRREDDILWVSEDKKNGMEILINPNTGVEFHTSWLSRRSWSPDRTYLLAYDFFARKDGSTHVTTWDYVTGKIMWSYVSHANELKAEFKSEVIVFVGEKFGSDREIIDDSRTNFSFYNITNGALLLQHVGGPEALINIVAKPDRLIIYAREAYDRKLKLIGEIFK